MTCAEESIDTKREKDQSNTPLQEIHWKKMLDKTQDENCQGDRGCVSEGDREEGADDCGAAVFLQAKGQREQPAHSWIQPVVRPENGQSNPGPSVIHG
jgi:hypothetical protein